MLRAAVEADRKSGLGLWFACPGEYRAIEFLAALSETLADAVERRFPRDRTRARAIRWLQFLLMATVGLPVATAVGVYLVRGLGSGKADRGSLISVLPHVVWLVVGIAAAALLVLLGARAVWESRPSGRLVREAKTMRERIRFAASVRLGNEIQLGRNGSLTGTLRRSRERTLDERPVTLASAVFDFRNLAMLISEVLRGPLVIGIDELDKVIEPQIARDLLRAVKAIFEITGVFFLVAMSEETAGPLEMGSSLPDGRSEFNSSFYTVLELPPLDLQETAELLAARSLPDNDQLASVLCVLGEGNWREIIRLAEHAASLPEGASREQLNDLIMAMCATETSALLREITRNAVAAGVGQLADEAKMGAWNAFPPDSFSAEGRFVALTKAAIHEWWQPRWHDAAAWQAFREPWQRLLVRLYIGGQIIVILERLAVTDPTAVDVAMTDLRDVMIMADSSPGVAKFMLADRFGVDLGGPYRPV